MSTEDLSCATVQHNFSFVELSKIVVHVPVEFHNISENSKICVILYSILFLFAFPGNCFILRSLLRRHSNTQTRLTLLLINLSLADILVCLAVIPLEVFWRLTIQWRGGNIICKLAQFSRAFALFLSSFVLICISVDRYLAIHFPLRSLPRVVYIRVTFMLATAWGLAALFAFPQLIFFRIETHPKLTHFDQCVNDFISTPLEIEVYSIFSVVTLYIVPLVITLLTCCTVSWKLFLESRRRLAQHALTVQFISGERCEALGSSLTSCRNISRAANRTFLMAVVILGAFVCCWTPYSTLTLWYLLDWDAAVKVDPLAQDICFLMAVTNSGINPLVYGIFHQSWR